MSATIRSLDVGSVNISDVIRPTLIARSIASLSPNRSIARSRDPSIAQSLHRSIIRSLPRSLDAGLCFRQRNTEARGSKLVARSTKTRSKNALAFRCEVLSNMSSRVKKQNVLKVYAKLHTRSQLYAALAGISCGLAGSTIVGVAASG